MTDTPADEGTAHQGRAITDVPTREQPTVVPPSSHEGLLLLLAILYTVVAVILITHGDSETPLHGFEHGQEMMENSPGD